MDKSLFDQIITFLQPHMVDADERRATVELALHGCNVLGQIDWRGAAAMFTIRLVRTLDEYGMCEPGTPAIVAVLETLRTQVGSNKQSQIDTLISNLTQPKGNSPMLDPVTQTAAIGFLIEIGRWAKTELSERWTVGRKQKSTNLSDKEAVETEVPALLNDAVSGQSSMDVSRTMALIARKRDAIYRHKNAILSDGDEELRKDIPHSAYEERLAYHNAEIKKLMNEIEGDLESLGFKVTREAAK